MADLYCTGSVSASGRKKRLEDARQFWGYRCTAGMVTLFLTTFNLDKNRTENCIRDVSLSQDD